MTRDLGAQAWRTALDSEASGSVRCCRPADTRLTEIRRHVPDAGGLGIASDQESSSAYGRLLARVSGERPTLVLSDEPRLSRRIADFAAGESRWLVVVRMVSEGVDVPRLAVGVYATSTSTPLYVAQAVGRFVRRRRRGETASVLLLMVPALLSYAGEMEVERDHVLGRVGRATTRTPPLSMTS